MEPLPARARTPARTHSRRFAFPEVDPEWDCGRVAALAPPIVERAIADAATAAMVQGEFVLAFTLVNCLERAGIPCYAATSRRMTVVEALPDGATRKVVRFEFVRFRRYCATC